MSGLLFEFGAVRTASGPSSRRGRERVYAFMKMAPSSRRSRDVVSTQVLGPHVRLRLVGGTDGEVRQPEDPSPEALRARCAGRVDLQVVLQLSVGDRVVRAGTWAVLTYVRQDRWVADQASLDMDIKRCSHFLVREEGNHSREEGWYLLRGLESAMLSFDFRHLPNELVYDEHYRLAIFVRPSRCVEEECDAARNFLGPKERYPCRQPIHLSNWC